MSKFYVETGNVKETVDCDNIHFAAAKAIIRAVKQRETATVGRVVTISEIGFGSSQRDTKVLELEAVILPESLEILREEKE